MNLSELQQLVAYRWEDVLRSPFGPFAEIARITSNWGTSAMLDVPRRYASIVGDGGEHCHLQFARRMETAPFTRADGVIRHELGHALDFVLGTILVDQIAMQHYGEFLPGTVERRADALARLVWGTPIYYEAPDWIQTTEPVGLAERPECIGL